MHALHFKHVAQILGESEISSYRANSAVNFLVRRDSKLKDSNLELPAKLPATSASLGFLGGAGRWLLDAMASLGTSCAYIEESTMMRGELRVLSRTDNTLKNMNKINLVPERGA